MTEWGRGMAEGDTGTGDMADCLRGLSMFARLLLLDTGGVDVERAVVP